MCRRLAKTWNIDSLELNTMHMNEDSYDSRDRYNLYQMPKNEDGLVRARQSSFIGNNLRIEGKGKGKGSRGKGKGGKGKGGKGGKGNSPRYHSGQQHMETGKWSNHKGRRQQRICSRQECATDPHLFSHCPVTADQTCRLPACRDNQHLARDCHISPIIPRFPYSRDQVSATHPQTSSAPINQQSSL